MSNTTQRRQSRIIADARSKDPIAHGSHPSHTEQDNNTSHIHASVAEVAGRPLGANAGTRDEIIRTYGSISAAIIALTPNHPIAPSRRFIYAAEPELAWDEKIIEGTITDGIVYSRSNNECTVRMWGWVIYVHPALSMCQRFAAKNKLIFGIPAEYHSTSPDNDPDPTPTDTAASSYLLTNEELGHAGDVPDNLAHDDSDVPEPPKETPEREATRKRCMALVREKGFKDDSVSMRAASLDYFGWFCTSRKQWTAAQWQQMADAIEGGVWLEGFSGNWVRALRHRRAA